MAFFLRISCLCLILACAAPVPAQADPAAVAGQKRALATLLDARIRAVLDATP
jgi:hypothetical protein